MRREKEAYEMIKQRQILPPIKTKEKSGKIRVWRFNLFSKPGLKPIVRSEAERRAYATVQEALDLMKKQPDYLSVSEQEANVRAENPDLAKRWDMARRVLNRRLQKNIRVKNKP